MPTAALMSTSSRFIPTKPRNFLVKCLEVSFYFCVVSCVRQIMSNQTSYRWYCCVHFLVACLRRRLLLKSFRCGALEAMAAAEVFLSSQATLSDSFSSALFSLHAEMFLTSVSAMFLQLTRWVEQLEPQKGHCGLDS